LPGFEDLEVVAAVDPPAPSARAFRVDIVRSARRSKSVGARLKGGVLTVTVPTWMGTTEAERWAQEMARRFDRRLSADRVDIDGRARRLADRLDLPHPQSVRWVDMKTRWGSCTPSDRSIRLSRQLVGFPDWGIDYVLVHELAHLRIGGHTKRFWALVDRYPLAERARGYLIAKSNDGDDID